MRAFAKTTKTAELRQELKKIITPENYRAPNPTGPPQAGFKDNEWNLTELLQLARRTSGPPVSIVAFQIIMGLDRKGRRAEAIPLVNVPYRLEVLTRQACCKTHDGKIVNGWQQTMVENVSDRYRGDIIAPKADELPQPGDLVNVKGNFIKIHPESEDPLLYAERSQMLMEGRPIYEENLYSVDAHGCINFPSTQTAFGHALQCLKLKGLRLVAPEFHAIDRAAAAKGELRGKKIEETQRTITNWHFREVPPDYKRAPDKGKK